MWLFEYFEVPWIKYLTAGMALIFYLLDIGILIGLSYHNQGRSGNGTGAGSGSAGGEGGSREENENNQETHPLFS